MNRGFSLRWKLLLPLLLAALLMALLMDRFWLQRSLANVERTQLQSVITSYSIHYTKLYEATSSKLVKLMTQLALIFIHIQASQLTSAMMC